MTHIASSYFHVPYILGRTSLRVMNELAINASAQLVGFFFFLALVEL